MKRTLFSICALVLSLTASAQIIKDTPKGKLIENLYRSSKSWVKKGWTGVQQGRYEGLVSKIVIGDDGCIYIYNPLSGLDSKSWLKLEKQADGKYRAKLPQDILTDDLGGDDDEEESSERTISLIRMISNDDGKSYEPIGATMNYVDFTWENNKLVMKGMGQKKQIWGAAFNNKWERNYGGDWALTIEPLKEQLITPPATATKSQYTVTSKSDPSPRIVEAMTDNNDIYVKGLFKAEKLANTWVKLTKQGDKAVMSTNQYLGITKKTDFKKYDSDKSEYHTFAAAFENGEKTAENLEFSIDATGKLTTSKILRTSLGRASNDNITGEDYVESYEGLTLTPYIQKAGKPATPVYYYFTSTPDYSYTFNEIKLAFYVKNTDVDGNYLDPEKMYYNVYVNGSTEPFKFKKTESQYRDMHEDEMTNIPFNYQDKRNHDFKVSDNIRILNFYDSSITTAKVVMVYEADGKKYSSEPMVASLTTDGIESANFNKTTTEKYYTVDGRQIQKLQKGLNIIKSSDGTTRKVVVK
ncbi:hypothetical protein [Prevotella melaninogenica]